jgi:hypothetical protein
MLNVRSYTYISANVGTFKNFRPWQVCYMQDVTSDTREGVAETVVQAARNMIYLTKASFVENPLAIEVVDNLSSYSRLTDLTIEGFKPEEHKWQPNLTALKRLHWTLASAQRRSENPYSHREFPHQGRTKHLPRARIIGHITAWTIWFHT